MNKKMEFAIISLVLVAGIILIPLGIAVFMHGEQPYRIIPGEPLKEAASAAGLSVCSETDIVRDIPGLTGDKSYVLSDECTAPSKTVTVEVLAFDSAESRDAAVRYYNSGTVGKSKSGGSLIVLGQYLIHVNGYNSDLFGRVAAELKKI